MTTYLSTELAQTVHILLPNVLYVAVCNDVAHNNSGTTKLEAGRNGSPDTFKIID